MIAIRFYRFVVNAPRRPLPRDGITVPTSLRVGVVADLSLNLDWRIELLEGFEGTTFQIRLPAADA